MTKKANNYLTYTVTEVCPHCEHEVEIHGYDVEAEGYTAFCPYCGKRLMLCDECLHSVDSKGCDYSSTTDMCWRREKNMYDRAMNARLEDLLRCYKPILWGVKPQRRYKKKCDKCNSVRQFEFTLPSGKIVMDNCKCGDGKTVYIPQMKGLYELSIRDDKKPRAWYSIVETIEGGQYLQLGELGNIAEIVIDHDRDFDTIDNNERYGAFFKTKEECQQFCDYLNSGIDLDEYKYSQDGELISETKQA